MRLEVHPDALDEFEDAAQYYKRCQAGLELRFIACIEAALREISAAPERWRPFEQDVRRKLVHVFPYAVLFSMEADYVLIIAVMHCSRQPGYWRHRVKRRE